MQINIISALLEKEKIDENFGLYIFSELEMPGQTYLTGLLLLKAKDFLAQELLESLPICTQQSHTQGSDFQNYLNATSTCTACTNTDLSVF